MRNLALGSLLELENREQIANSCKGDIKSSAGDVELERYVKRIEARTDASNTK